MRAPLSRPTLALLVAAGLGAALTGCASTPTTEASADGAPDLVTDGALTVCTNTPYEPFEYEEAGQVVGLDIDLMQEVADDLGVEVTVVVTAFEGIQSGADLDVGKCDVVASAVTITDERAAKFDFSQPYFDADQGLLVPAGSGIDSLEELDGVDVGVQQATTGEDWAVENDLAAVQFEELGLQVQALRTGQVGAVLNDIAVLGAFVDDSTEIGTVFPTGEQYGFGVRKGNVALLAAIDATLERIAEDGTYEALYTARVGTAPADS
ncbi:ABC transporter substrate-binding protein [Actinotalea sp. K2]|uniref:ABC transporter substrate-binding protein n=1 Tax=Actinotalea sp. K2 TaxID=2939438 RepID=UPI0020170381|nr:ABC transporter substrate-binding protein [Actinotalea sp. K2]MCL3860294.1 ABC transporter substrate-binding protein [Actinotalea sp. K2]